MRSVPFLVSIVCSVLVSGSSVIYSAVSDSRVVLRYVANDTFSWIRHSYKEKQTSFMELVISALFSLKLRKTYYVMSYIFRARSFKFISSYVAFLGLLAETLKSSQFRGYYHAYIVRTCACY